MARAEGAGAIKLDQRVARLKPGFFGGLGERLGNIDILDFRHGSTFAADEELHGVMAMITFRARDKGIQPFQLMNEMIFDQKIQGAIHCWRDRAFANLL